MFGEIGTRNIRMPWRLCIRPIAAGLYVADETRIPIPWDDFKAAPNASLLVLDTTKSVLDAAPHVSKNAFTVGASADGDSQKDARVGSRRRESGEGHGVQGHSGLSRSDQ
jgi:hypothetical protein